MVRDRPSSERSDANDDESAWYDKTRRELLKTTGAGIAGMAAIGSVTGSASAADPAPEWDPDTAYESGSRVYWDGSVWEAEWHSEDQEPGVEDWYAWNEVAPVTVNLSIENLRAAQYVDDTVVRVTEETNFREYDTEYEVGEIIHREEYSPDLIYTDTDTATLFDLEYETEPAVQPDAIDLSSFLSGTSIESKLTSDRFSGNPFDDTTNYVGEWSVDFGDIDAGLVDQGEHKPLFDDRDGVHQVWAGLDDPPIFENHPNLGDLVVEITADSEQVDGDSATWDIDENSEVGRGINIAFVGVHDPQYGQNYGPNLDILDDATEHNPSGYDALVEDSYEHIRDSIGLPMRIYQHPEPIKGHTDGDEAMYRDFRAAWNEMQSVADDGISGEELRYGPDISTVNEFDAVVLVVPRTNGPSGEDYYTFHQDDNWIGYARYSRDMAVSVLGGNYGSTTLHEIIHWIDGGDLYDTPPEKAPRNSAYDGFPMSQRYDTDGDGDLERDDDHARFGTRSWELNLTEDSFSYEEAVSVMSYDNGNEHVDERCYQLLVQNGYDPRYDYRDDVSDITGTDRDFGVEEPL